MSFFAEQEFLGNVRISGALIKRSAREKSPLFSPDIATGFSIPVNIRISRATALMVDFVYKNDHVTLITKHGAPLRDM